MTPANRMHSCQEIRSVHAPRNTTSPRVPPSLVSSMTALQTNTDATGIT